ncbi:MAG: response regulator transcription factor [Ignavibacteriales bacterium]|nr:response regulator transcription factor [Ignavibacteriales bacterium]
MKIMIVDDNAGIRQMIKDSFSGLFKQFYECSNGKQAVNDYNKYKPDWVLMDIKMKEMNGISATNEIVKSYPEAKIIITTNFNDDSLRIAAREAGALAYVLKENLSSIQEIILGY